VASRHETAVEALRAFLAAINTNDGYSYTPGAVVRINVFPDQISLDSSLQTIYLIRPGEEVQELKDSGNTAVHLEIFILVVGRFLEPTDNPHEAEQLRWQMAADMVHDVLQKLGTDNRLGAPSVVIDCARGGYRTDYERYLHGWALAEIRMVLHFHRATAGR